ncbi:30S ribosomal protein S9 [Merdimonas faecis]|uniref:30S ribosomal protein S9 n=1 Tax=Merdimonas faecis TaxID=1653435 RepID=UPI001FA78330|nr:30S ribosomal protein S9 [Merdimonas faecis]
MEEFREDFAEDSGKKVLAADVKYYATGRRKTAVARVYLADGNGKIIVNQKPIESYFSGGYYREKVLMPLELTGTYGAVDVYATVKGGGVTGQAEAIRHGISRALINIAIDSKKMLKDEGYLTRDPRMKERKKSGLKGARRKPQRSKR